MIYAADRTPMPCPICGDDAFLCGVVDFHKSCIEAEGRFLPKMGIPVYYRQCVRCRFLFCDTFKDWTREDFAAHIYNGDYGLVDPDYELVRPNGNAEMLVKAIGPKLAELRLIDFGGGNGRFAAALREQGFDAESFDPLAETATPSAPADIVTAFEVVEHSNQQHQTLHQMLALLKPDGLLLFSTYVQPQGFNPLSAQGLNWWYVAPRNGHISIHSRDSLTTLLASQGLSLHSLNHYMHIAFRSLPDFAKHLIA